MVSGERRTAAPSPMPTGADARGSSAARWRRALVVGACVLVVLAVALVYLLRHGTPVAALGVFAGYLVAGVVAPGFALARVLLGPQRSLAGDLAVGAGVGLLAGLLAWALFTAAGVQSWLWLWPAACALLLLHGRSRRRILARPRGRWSEPAVVAVSLAIVLAILNVDRSFLAAWALPPTDRSLYPDLLWHMSLVSESMRSIPLHIPQASTLGTLRYHWFSNAAMGLSALMTGIDVPILVLRLWPVTLIVLVIALTATAAHVVSRRQLAVGVAALTAMAGVVLTPWWLQLNLQDVLRPISPSQLYGFVPLLVAVVAVSALIRRSGRRLIGPAIVTLLALVVAAGAKPTLVPLLCAGAAVAAVALALRRRREWLRFALIAGAGAVLTLGSMIAVAGGDGGSGVMLLHLVTLAPFAREISGTTSPDAGWIVPGVTHDLGFAIAVCLAFALMVVRPLLGAVLMIDSRLRRQPMAWLLGGACAAAVFVTAVLGHPGYSQIYFAQTAVPLGAILIGWWSALVVTRRGVPRGALVGGAVAGTVVAVVSLVVAPRIADARPGTVVTSLVVAAVALVAGVVVLLLFLRRPRSRPAAAAALAGALLSGFLVSAVYTPIAATASPPTTSAAALDQTLAAAWIADHTDPDDLMAVNDHCLGEEAETCDARSWWVSGWGGRRVLIEGWSYVPESVAISTDPIQRTVYDRELLEFNQSLFTAPTEESIGRAAALGVTYLVASAGATDVSPDLARWCTTTYRNDTVTICRLHAD